MNAQKTYSRSTGYRSALVHLAGFYDLVWLPRVYTSCFISEGRDPWGRCSTVRSWLWRGQKF